MQRSHQVAIWTFLSGVFVLSGVVCASAEEILIRRFGTRVECFDPDAAHRWSDDQKALAERQCGQASGGRFTYAAGKLILLGNDRTELVYSDSRQDCISGNGDSCTWVNIDSFDIQKDFAVIELNGYESYEYDFVNLKDGSKRKLWERPNFSPSGQWFIVVRSEQETEMEDEFTIYSIRNGALIPDSGLSRNANESYQVWSFRSWQDDGTVRLHVEYRPLGDENFKDADVILQRRPDGIWTMIGWPVR